MVYDGLIVVALWMVATALLLPFTGGEAIQPDNGLYNACLVLLSFGYFGWFWTHGGQTPGMRTWNLRLTGAARHRVTWRQAFTRFLGACISWLALGLGFLWLLVDVDRRTWHDRLSATVLVDAS